MVMTRIAQRVVLFLQSLSCVPVAMDKADGAGPLLHSFYKMHQVILIRVGGVAADGGDTRPDGAALAVEFDPAVAGAVLLNGATGGALSLVADEQDLMAFIFEHGFEVIHHPAPGGHAARRQDDGRAAGLGEVVHGLQVFFVAVDGVEVVKAQWVPTGLEPFLGFGVPEGFKLPIHLGEFGGQG